ncbi:MAG: protein translocase subunit SecF [Alphaproteobacteria bacterium]|nr:protein translocase subunit SecF [Alphaproteobacteria bacterium]MBU6471167.1 protein translocase subunit SecF [Alphaproteobacteria bacterium]MDE2013670.1 protein translocase subunit SecF [Alphaproteobacteria bacterium]MDE2072706.1 protein translocase subunit SecF [Alphaproteobacteria bacterium]
MPLIRFLPDNTKINFVGARYYAFALDGLLVLITIASIAIHGFNLGIDFTGGVLLQVKSQHAIDVAQARAQVDSLNFGDAEIQYIGGGACDVPANSCVLIRVKPKIGQSGEEAASEIRAKLGPSFTSRNAQVIGPKVSQELFHAGVMATLLAVLMIAVYVAVRFEWQYGIGAVVATGHDVLVTAGLFSVLHWDFTLTSIAALLTLAGYSINDTVVVFDRIRENRRKYKKMPLGDLINLSTNQMLTRTVLTSFVTAISIVPLLLFGGPALFQFTAAILFGIVVGTFSSIYVASALLLYLPAPAGHVGGGATEATTG